MKTAIRCGIGALCLLVFACVPVWAEDLSLPSELPPVMDPGPVSTTPAIPEYLPSNGLDPLPLTQDPPAAETTPPNEIPEPSALVLLLSGLLGAGVLSLMAWRRQAV
jgi:hypothetical protein